MLSLDWAGGSAEAQPPYRRAGKLRNTTVAVLETQSPRDNPVDSGSYRAGQQFAQVYPTVLQQTQRNFLANPILGRRVLCRVQESCLRNPGFRLEIQSPPHQPFLLLPGIMCPTPQIHM